MSDQDLSSVILEIIQGLGVWGENLGLVSLGEGTLGLDFTPCLRYDLVQFLNHAVYEALMSQEAK